MSQPSALPESSSIYLLVRGANIYFLQAKVSLKLLTLLGELAKVSLIDNRLGGMYTFSFEPTKTSVAKYDGSIFGSESRPPSEKICSTLPS